MIVYTHKRKDNDKIFYVGATKNIKRLNSKDGRNKYWHTINDLVGFYSEIVHECDTHKEAYYTEQYLIAYYGRLDKGKGNLVNMTDGGIGHKGMIWSEENRLRSSKLHKGNKYRLGHKMSKKNRDILNKVLYKPVLQYSKDGTLLNEWDSVISASNKLNINQSHIAEVSRGNSIRKTAGGYIWKY